MINLGKVEDLPRVGQFYAKKLAKLGVRTVDDLLFYVPFRYDDLSLVSPVAKTQIGEVVTVCGEMVQLFTRRTNSGKWMQKGVLKDESGEMEVTWFNQPFLVRALKGKRVALAGKVEQFGNRRMMTSPSYELVNEKGKDGLGQIHTGRLVPVYPETEGLSSKWLRGRIKEVIRTRFPIEDYLPEFLRQREKLVEINQALQGVHFPRSSREADKARGRLAFDELLILHLAGLVRRAEWRETTPTHALKIDGEKVFVFLNQLPFELTGAQKRAIQEVLHDLGQNVPMNRLLSGDVGSGKTVVAALAIYVAYLNGLQSAMMAPTQILAAQHFKTLEEILAPLGVKVELVLSGKKAAGEGDVLVGTHALIHKRADFLSLALVVIDEQHKFGVEQRAHLVNKGQSPHVLTMTATPIPRTIALTVFGDLDLGTLDELPPGRKLPKTRIVLPEKQEVAYEWVKEKIKKEKVQAFVVCPLIEESEVETMQSVKAVNSEYKRLKGVFPELNLGLLHGRMKVGEKQKILDRMLNGDLDILVTTPVVEVGMDIPCASIMVVEGAQRFGLAQLHQLRGRVGRRGQQGYCLLFTDSLSGKNRVRLEAMEKITLGSELAELDLSLRGPGEVFGIRQHGFGELAIASFSDRELIERTREVAEEILPNLRKFVPLWEKVRKQMRKIMIEPN